MVKELKVRGEEAQSMASKVFWSRKHQADNLAPTETRRVEWN